MSVAGHRERKLVVFADPNCGYCKKFERDLQEVKNVTVYTFLYPILGADSTEKSKAIWCAKDNTKAWRDWMLKNTLAENSPNCDASALQRNFAFGKKHRINGTPGLVLRGRQARPRRDRRRADREAARRQPRRQALTLARQVPQER